MKYVKYLIIFGLIATTGVAAWQFRHFFHLERKSATAILFSLQKTKGIDRLYTGIYHIPIMDLHTGYLKRDVLNEGIKTYFNPVKQFEKIRRFVKDEPLLQGNEARNVVTGCCSKKYEVAIGYDHLLQLLQDEALVTEICSGNLAKLPEPEILAVNCKSTTVFGKYDSSGACYTWDSDEKLRKQIIHDTMQADDVLASINSRGKDALKNFIIAFCN